MCFFIVPIYKSFNTNIQIKQPMLSRMWGCQIHLTFSRNFKSYNGADIKQINLNLAPQYCNVGLKLLFFFGEASMCKNRHFVLILLYFSIKIFELCSRTYMLYLWVEIVNQKKKLKKWGNANVKHDSNSFVQYRPSTQLCKFK